LETLQAVGARSRGPKLQQSICKVLAICHQVGITTSQSLYPHKTERIPVFFFSSRVATLPENLPKIDFEAYKKQMKNKACIEKLEKGVRISDNVPYFDAKPLTRAFSVKVHELSSAVPERHRKPCRKTQRA
jgi:hypothetical protein